MSKQGYNSRDAVICKGCHSLHFFDSAELAVYRTPITFPKGDFAIYQVICPHDDKFYEYSEDEVRRHAEERSDEQLQALQDRLKAVESRLGILESPKWIQEKKDELEKLLLELLAKQDTKKIVATYG